MRYLLKNKSYNQLENISVSFKALNKLRKYNLEDFQQSANEKNIFIPIEHIKKNHAERISNFWLTFSALMPRLLRKAADNIDRHEHKKSLLEIADEELGNDSTGIAHFLLFKNACAEIDINPRFEKIAELDKLYKYTESNSNSVLLGLCFGLEIIANENIEYLIRSLAYGPDFKSKLESTVFFKVHRKNEDEHIRKNFENYERYCNSFMDIYQFSKGYNFALDFWKIFWTNATSLTKEAI